MIDIVFPNKNESSFIDIGKKLGFKALIFVYKDNKEAKAELDKIKDEIKDSEIKIIPAIKLEKEIKTKTKTKEEITIYEKASRNVIEKIKPTIIYNQEKIAKKDAFSYRNSGINHIIAKIMHENNQILCFNIKLLRENNNRLYLGRMFQNALLARKYKLNFIIASMATKPLEMRSFHDIKAFAITLGFNPGEVKENYKKLSQLFSI